MRLKLPPIVRVSLGLVFLTCSLLLGADMVIGLSPDYTATILDARKKLIETLAVQNSRLAQDGNFDTVAATLGAVVERNPDVLSAALRRANGAIITQTKGHGHYWSDAPEKGSTPTHAQVPILAEDQHWGTVELRFTELGYRGLANPLRDPFNQLLLFVMVVGFLAYWLFMKKTLRHLDPAAVIPDRVKAALDVLTEGVVVLDESDGIVLANTSFAKMVGKPFSELLGGRLSELAWSDPTTGGPPRRVPWLETLRASEVQTGNLLCLTTPGKGVRTYNVNTSAIEDDAGKIRGALATFDDITELEQKNSKLESMLHELRASKREIERQNDRLTILATRDPLTNCYNRRTFFEKLEAQFADAGESEVTFACIMADIDKFKLVNDTYGHVVGDQVIRQVSAVLQGGVRTIDVVGRYGGEEFCMILPTCGQTDAMRIAETLRETVAATPNDALGLPPEAASVTSSFGVTTNDQGAQSAMELIEQADRALYASKTGGRNRVTSWNEVADADSDAA